MSTDPITPMHQVAVLQPLHHSGVMAQLHHAYQSMNSGTVAPSALLKAAMLNTANDLGNDGPDFIYGWVNCAYKAAKLLEENRFLSATVAPERNTHTINIPTGVQRAKIMIYWADQKPLHQLHSP